MPRKFTPEQRIAKFWEKIDRSGGPNACWPWTRAKYSTGYGAVMWLSELTPAHRIAFYLEHDRWPEPCALHRCDNRPCCNPAHLFEGTKADNSHDCVTKGRAKGQPQGESHRDAKLTEDDVREIRHLHEVGVGQRELGRHFGVDHRTIAALLNGKTWKCVN